MSSSRSPRVSMASLPPELVFQCLDQLHHDTAITQRHQLLLVTSMVSRAWAHHSQALLWRTLTCGGYRGAQRLLSSPAVGKFATRSLQATDASDYNAGAYLDSLELLLSKLHGLRELNLWRISPGRLLCHPAVEDLQSLGISLPPADLHILPPSTPSFTKLQTLSLDIVHWKSSWSSLLPALQANSITSLSLNFWRAGPPEDLQIFTDLLTANVAISLIHLKLQQSAPTTLLPFLHSCELLQHLHLELESTEELDNSIRSVSSEVLKEIEVVTRSGRTLQAWMGIVRFDHLKGLRKLKMKRSDHSFVSSGEFVKKCARGGIAVEF